MTKISRREITPDSEGCPGRDYLRSEGRSTGGERRAGSKRPGLEQMRRGRLEYAQADFGGQIGGQRQRWQKEHRLQNRCRNRQAKLRAVVLGLFQRKTAAIIAILAGVAHRLIIHCTLKNLKAGKGFELAMRGGRQPEERCQGENDVSEMPHVSIDTRRRTNVQSNLRACV